MPRSQDLATACVHVCTLDVRRGSAADAEQVLTRDERRRADAAADPAVGRRFAIVRAALRRVLGEALGVDPALVPIVAGPHGKPVLAAEAGRDLWFSVSTHGDRALIDVTACGPVGVDLDEIARAPGRSIEADLRVFTAAERAAVARGDRSLRCARTWVCKEAVAKAWGLGIEGFSRFSVEIDSRPPRVTSDESALRRIALVELPEEQGLVAALACLVGSDTALDVRRAILDL